MTILIGGVLANQRGVWEGQNTGTGETILYNSGEHWSEKYFKKLTSGAVSSSVNQVSMLSLTAQWQDEDFVLKKAALHSCTDSVYIWKAMLHLCMHPVGHHNKIRNNVLIPQ